MTPRDLAKQIIDRDVSFCANVSEPLIEAIRDGVRLNEDESRRIQFLSCDSSTYRGMDELITQGVAMLWRHVVTDQSDDALLSSIGDYHATTIAAQQAFINHQVDLLQSAGISVQC